MRAGETDGIENVFVGTVTALENGRGDGVITVRIASFEFNVIHGLTCLC